VRKVTPHKHNFYGCVNERIQHGTKRRVKLRGLVGGAAKHSLVESDVPPFTAKRKSSRTTFGSDHTRTRFFAIGDIEKRLGNGRYRFSYQRVVAVDVVVVQGSRFVYHKRIIRRSRTVPSSRMGSNSSSVRMERISILV
jgi:hypothetical protein